MGGDVNNYQQLCAPREDNLPHFLVCTASGDIIIFFALLIIKIIKWSHSNAPKGLHSGFGVKGLGCERCYF